jgi:hypothetical protein
LRRSFSKIRQSINVLNLGHALALADVLARANLFDWFIRSAEAHRRTEELLALSTEHDFPLYLGWAMALRGWGLVTLGEAREGLMLLKRGLAAVRATGAQVRPDCYSACKIDPAYCRIWECYRIAITADTPS